VQAADRRPPPSLRPALPPAHAHRSGSLTFRGLTLTGFAPPRPAAGPSPLAGFALSPGAALRVDGCLLHFRGELPALAGAMPFWAAAAAAGALVGADGAPLVPGGGGGGGNGGALTAAVNYTANAMGQAPGITTGVRVRTRAGRTRAWRP
jgi:hypothetical protein